MTVAFAFDNFIATETLSAIAAADTSISIPPTVAAQMTAVSPGNNNQLCLALWDGQNSPEIVYCTNNPQSGILTIVRGREGTAAFAWGAGTQVSETISGSVLTQALAGYVGNQNLYLPLAGGTMTGVLNIAADPVANSQAANKHYVDTVVAGLGSTYLPLAGGTMAGNISMASNRVLSLPAPLTGSEPATKTYVDAATLILTNEMLDRAGSLLTTGSSTAFTLTTNFGYGAGVTDGTRLSFRLHANMAPGATLAIDGTAAVQLSATTGLAVQATRHVKGEILSVVYRAATPEWIIENPDVLYTEQFTTTHIGNAYSVTTGYGLNSFGTMPDGTIITIILDNANTAAATLNVDGIGSGPLRPLVGVDFTNGQLQANQILPCRWRLASGEWLVEGISPQAVVYGYDTANNLSLGTPTVSANVLTVAIKAANTGLDPTPQNPVTLEFGDTTLPAGDPVQLQITGPLSISTIVGAHFGASVANQAFRLWLTCFNNSATPVLGLSCQSLATATSVQVLPLDEASLATSVAMSAGSTTLGQIYTPAGTTITSKAYRILGYMDYASGLATPGTYNNAPTKTRLFGPGVKKPGDIVQSNRVITGAVATGTTTASAWATDNVPTNVMGDHYAGLDISITPSASANILEVEVQAFFASNVAGPFGMMLLQDATVNSLTAAQIQIATTNVTYEMKIHHEMLAAAVASTTFKINAGNVNANTTTFNGVSGGRNLGGKMNSFARVREIMG